jgi:hypothetical protein
VSLAYNKDTIKTGEHPIRKEVLNMTNFKFLVTYQSGYGEDTISPVAGFRFEQDAIEYIEKQNPTLQHRYTIIKADK